MCVLQPRQLFARAADGSANELPAERVLRTPEDAAGCFRLLPALLPPAVRVCRPAVPSPRAGGCAGIAQGCGRGWAASPSAALALRAALAGQEIGSWGLVGFVWGFGVSWGAAVGHGGSLLSLHNPPRVSQRCQDSSGTGGTDRGALLPLQAAGGCPRARRASLCQGFCTQQVWDVLPNTSLRAGASWETPQGAAAIPQLRVPLS